MNRSCFNCRWLDSLFSHDQIKSVGVLCRRDYFAMASTRQATLEVLFMLSDVCPDFDWIRNQGMVQHVLAVRWLDERTKE